MKKSILLGLGAVAMAMGVGASVTVSAKLNAAPIETQAAESEWDFYLWGDEEFVAANTDGGASWSTLIPMAAPTEPDSQVLAQVSGISLGEGMEFEVVAKKKDGSKTEYKNQVADGNIVLQAWSNHVIPQAGITGTYTLSLDTDWYLLADIKETGHYLYFTDSFWMDNRNFYGWYGQTKGYGDWPGTKFQDAFPEELAASFVMPGIKYNNNNSGLDNVYKVPTALLNGSVNYKISDGSGESETISIYWDQFFTGDSNAQWEDANLALHFIENYMHMAENTPNQCLDYYPLAKEAYEPLTAEVKGVIQNRFAQAYNRYVEWGKAYDASQASARLALSMQGGSNNMFLITGLIVFGTISAGAVIFIAKKRKEN